MSDFDRDELLLSGAFEEFTTGSTPKINAEGTAAVRRRVARRRRVRAVLLVLLTALAIGVPVAVYAMSGRDVPAGPSQSASPSAGRSATTGPTPTAAAPTSSGIDHSLLRLSTITIPDWKLGDPAVRCQTGAAKLTGETKDGISGVKIVGDVIDADLDADPALEAAAILECLADPALPRQVVAFERDSTGNIITVGQVMRGHATALSRRSAAGDGITVDVASGPVCCEVSPEMQRHQQRGFAWNGRSFVQIDGPTSFGPHPRVTDLLVTTGPLTLGAAVDGTRTGTVQVTVANAGKVTSNRFRLQVAQGTNATISACRGGQCFRAGAGDFPVIAGIVAGKKSTYTVTITIAAAEPIGPSVTITVAALGSKDTGLMADLKPLNNTAQAEVEES